MTDTRRHHWSVDEDSDGERRYISPDLTYEGKVMVQVHPYDAEGAAVTLFAMKDGSSAVVALTATEAAEMRDWLGVALEVIATERS